MKTEFELEMPDLFNGKKLTGTIRIVGMNPKNPPYVAVSIPAIGGDGNIGWIDDKDIERFAVNILKALKSKKLETK